MAKYLIIVIVILLASLAGTSALLKSSWETNAKLEVQYQSQQDETKKAIAQTTRLRLDHQQQVHEMDTQLKDSRRDTAELSKASKRIQATSDTLAKALNKKPDQASRVAGILYARGMRNICRSSGGTPANCKIIIPKSTKTKPRNPAKGRTGEPDLLAK
tara:strand:+ start:387 stop:863 length:477 start_codon:yes stop_codon:yes gene_type:complete